MLIQGKRVVPRPVNKEYYWPRFGSEMRHRTINIRESPGRGRQSARTSKFVTDAILGSEQVTSNTGHYIQNIREINSPIREDELNKDFQAIQSFPDIGPNAN